MKLMQLNQMEAKIIDLESKMKKHQNEKIIKEMAKEREKQLYGMTEFIKSNMANLIDHIDELTNSNKEIVLLIQVYLENLPEELHKCIGCPCYENDYPDCYKCNFYDDCIQQNYIYPKSCFHGDCNHIFNWMRENSSLIELKVKKIRDII
ncbi:hypothetical protein [Vallitalea guaymasensis]|uniref:hypothetical protein n=1 Tax=Vallitalea guaymasensis TaxID=1185412 RepID=UPI000DE33831|nr:hypothetical protein [Vallitalea guaymasensis]